MKRRCGPERDSGLNESHRCFFMGVRERKGWGAVVRLRYAAHGVHSQSDCNLVYAGRWHWGRPGSQRAESDNGRAIMLVKSKGAASRPICSCETLPDRVAPAGPSFQMASPPRASR